MQHALVLDIGNTSVKLGIVDDDSVRVSFSLPTDIVQGGDLLGLRLCELLKQAERETGPLAIGSVMASSVVPAMNPLLEHACRRYLGLKVRFAHLDVPIPLQNHYENPAEVGADRLVAAFAARRLFPEAQSVISIDYGTATTFDCVTGNAYVGGLICPGIMSSLAALSSRTAQLPRIPLSVDNTCLAPGHNTVTSMNQGFLFGFAAMSEGLCARLKEGLPGPCPVVATGGFARAVAGVSTCVDAVRPELLLDGLRLLWLECRGTGGAGQ
ncbi:MAG TPA: type III pantothenate kinase [Candidatus Avidesulfovibrio excrementigallinarum]|nr:type III pantothenate kinase [Candidatus Avidesulfovibrio excrementigallinarum]